jgi:hypothetical protein
VIYVSGATNGLLKGVTIQGGYQNPGNGGGLFLTNCQNFTIAGCVIRSNTARGANAASVYGGGLYEVNSTLLVSGTLFQANGVVGGIDSWSYGGALAMAGGSVTARDCRVTANLAAPVGGNSSTYGAGLYVNGGMHLIRNCLMWGNANTPSGTSVSQGAGLHVAAGTGVVENCTIAGNRSEGVRQGGGFVTIRDSIIFSHINNDVVGVATGSVLNSLVANGDRVFTGVNGNLSGEPGMERGFYLVAGSPCVNAGSRSVVAAGLSGTTTRANGLPDNVDPVDLGYH